MIVVGGTRGVTSLCMIHVGGTLTARSDPTKKAQAWGHSGALIQSDLFLCANTIDE
jgi:hypothetical protein